MIIITESGLKFTLKDIINVGAQGTVYKAERNSKDYAIKMYDTISDDFMNNIIQLSLHGPPMKEASRDKNYVWPLHYFTTPKSGYVMDYVDLSTYSSLEEVMQAKVSIVDRVRIGIELLSSINNLHETKGKIYVDISQSNVLIDVDNCKIKIIDNDNIGFRAKGVVGTRGYMNKAILEGGEPNFESDTFACFVFLHELVFSRHPYDGEYANTFTTLEDGVSNAILEGKGYIFVEGDNSILADDKRPQAIWNYFLTKEVRELFIRMFTSSVRLDEAVNILNNFVKISKKCECGNLTSTDHCSICFKKLEE